MFWLILFYVVPVVIMILSAITSIFSSKVSGFFGINTRKDVIQVVLFGLVPLVNIACIFLAMCISIDKNYNLNKRLH